MIQVVASLTSLDHYFSVQPISVCSEKSPLDNWLFTASWASVKESLIVENGATIAKQHFFVPYRWPSNAGLTMLEGLHSKL